MKMIAWETAHQTARRDCSKEAQRKVSIYVILLKGNACNQAHFFFFFAEVFTNHKEQSSP